MTHSPEIARVTDTARGGRSTLRSAREEAKRLMSGWRQGESVDAREALAENPALMRDRSVVLDLALEEFCLRRERGEVLGPTTFRERFESFGVDIASSIERLVSIETLAEAHGIDPRATDWPTAGERIDDFDIVEELGRGGLGRAYLCRERSIGDRLVVAKLTEEVSNEARWLGRLNHSNVVPVFSVRRARDWPGSIICMPYLGRTTLQQVIWRGREHGGALDGAQLEDLLRVEGGDTHSPRDWADHKKHWVRCALLKDIAAALRHAHERGIIHGDVKPTNVLVTLRGALLIDFNLSGSMNPEGWARGGTLPYMAPELWAVLAGRDAGPVEPGPASDVYSLAMTAAELYGGGPLPTPQQADGATSSVLRSTLEAQQHAVREALAHIPRGSLLPDLLADCARPDASSRPASSTVHALLEEELRRIDVAATRVRLTRRMAIVSISSSVVVGTALWGGARGSSANGLYRRGVELLRQGKPALSMNEFDRVLRRDDGHAPARYSRAWALIRSRKLVEAMHDLRRLRRELAGDAFVLASLGYCFASMDNYTSGVANYDAIKGALKHDPAVLNNHGCCLWKGRTRQDSVTQITVARALLGEAVVSDEQCVESAANLALFETELLWDEWLTADAGKTAAAVEALLERAQRGEDRLIPLLYYGWAAREDTTTENVGREYFRRLAAEGISPKASLWDSHPAFASFRLDERLNEAAQRSAQRLTTTGVRLMEHSVVHPLGARLLFGSTTG